MIAGWLAAASVPWLALGTILHVVVFLAVGTPEGDDGRPDLGQILAVAKQIGACARQELTGMPIHSIDHKFERYRLFFTVEFNDPEKLKKKMDKKKRRGRPVTVTKDRVRVRKEPVDGEILGSLGTGTEVILLKKKGDWCQIITPRPREGWMICEALSSNSKKKDSKTTQTPQEPQTP